jgi:hypothetical protein
LRSSDLLPVAAPTAVPPACTAICCETLGRVVSNSMANFVAHNNVAKAGICLGNRQYAAVNSNFATRHTPGIYLFTLYQVKLPLKAVLIAIAISFKYCSIAIASWPPIRFTRWASVPLVTTFVFGSDNNSGVTLRRGRVYLIIAN